MSDSRITTVRKSDTINKSDIMFPIMFLGDRHGYPLESILRKIPSSPDIHIGVYPNIFPYTILEYLWIRPGIPGSKPWVAIGKLADNVYFLFTAFMTKQSDTFVNNGHMDLWISTRYSDLIQFGMDSTLYGEYISDTVNYQS